MAPLPMPLNDLKVTVAVRNFSDYHTSWNIARIYYQRVARFLCGNWASCWYEDDERETVLMHADVAVRSQSETNILWY